MGRGWGFSRRTLLRSWLVSLLGKRSAAANEPGFDPVSFSLRGFVPTAAFQRRYRMDAAILLLGAPLYTRQAAGGGYASVEISLGDSARAVALQFAAGSDPARAHGLNRFGILREALIERGELREFAFAGLMTRSREDSLDQGKKALAASPGAAEGVLARGRTSGSTFRSWIDTVDLAADCNWANLSETLCEALHRKPQAAARQTAPSSATTFLYAMQLAALCKDPLHRCEFTHAGRGYWLETRRHPARFLELVGTIHDQAGNRCAEFRTAYAEGDPSGLPKRIEYRPRPFLRLTFEAVPDSNQPPIPSVFPQESA